MVDKHYFACIKKAQTSVALKNIAPIISFAVNEHKSHEAPYPVLGTRWWINLEMRTDCSAGAAKCSLGGGATHMVVPSQNVLGSCSYQTVKQCAISDVKQPLIKEIKPSQIVFCPTNRRDQDQNSKSMILF